MFSGCGELSVVENNLLPLGVLVILRRRKVSWQMVSGDFFFFVSVFILSI